MTDTAAIQPLAAEAAQPARHRLPLATKLAFGVGDVGPAIVTAVNGFFIFDFLVNVAGLRPGMAGNIFLIAKVWDAVNDPLVGWLTDRTVSRLGRRRPWLLFGAVPFGLAFFLHWLVPPLSDGLKFWYYLAVALLLDTAFTIVLVPYTALTPELTPDYDERTSLTSVRLSFSILGGVLAAFFHTQIVSAVADPYLGHAVSAGIWAIAITVPWFITVAGTRERAIAQAEEAAPAERGPGYLAGLRIALSNRPFVLVTWLYLLSWLALQFVQTNLFIFAKDWVGMDAGQFGVLLLAIQFSSFAWVVVWARASERLGKKGVYYLGVTVFVLVELALFFVQPGQVRLVFVLGLIVGAGVSVVYLVPWSMLPDVIELDELHTGQRREGIFYGFFAFLQKLGLSLGLWVSGWVLQWAGYINAVPGQPPPVQPPSALLALRWLVGPAGAAILLLSVVIAYLYPITKERHAALRAELRARSRPSET